MAATIASAFSFDGTVLPAVARVSPRFGRPSLDETGIGQASSEFDQGVFEGEIAVDLYFRPANHNAIVQAMATRAGPKACVITFASGQTASGNVVVEEASPTVQVKSSLAMSCVLRCTGSWTIVTGVTGA